MHGKVNIGIQNVNKYVIMTVARGGAWVYQKATVVGTFLW
jgi:hypothetical protein